MRVYTFSAAGLTLANQPVTLAALFPGATRAIQIMRMWASQSGSATSAQQRIEWGLQAAGQPTVVSATPQPHEQSDPASQITGVGGVLAAGNCGVNASAEGAGAKTPIGQDAFNVVNGWTWLPTEEESIILTPGSASSFYLFLPAAPGSLTGWATGITFREIG